MYTKGMSREYLEPTFSNTKRTSFGKRAIEGGLRRHDLATRELIGVLVFNVRNQTDAADFFDSPIAIDVFDQRRLAVMDLVKGAGQAVRPERDVPVARLTRLGLYIVEQAVLVDDSIEDGLIPAVDAENIKSLIS